MPSKGQDSTAYSPPFQALVFDLGNVIVGHENRVMLRAIAARCRQPCSPRQVGELMRARDWQTGAAIADLHDEVRESLGYDAGWEAFVADWCCHFTVDPSMLALVEALQTNNRVMLFSNTNREHWEFLDAETGGRLSALEAYLSHEIRMAKPDPGAFAHVAERAGVDPARCIFFDDVADNVDGARRAGFQAEVFTGEAELRRLLMERGVRLGR